MSSYSAVARGSPSKNSDEDDEILNLLREWRLECLYKRCKTQSITLDVLRIMRIRHVEILLRDFNLGTQIMFEHQLEKWRKSVGAPPLNMCTESSMFATVNEPVLTSPFNSSSPTPVLSQSSLQSVQSVSSNAELANEVGSKPQTLGVDLSTILNSTTKGQQLFDFYSKSGEFREEHRAALITTIAEYFEQNGIHLSLPSSYILEQEIIKIFPTEQLDFYRTGKRGRIYNKFANLKSISKHLYTSTKVPAETKKVHSTSETSEPEEISENVISWVKQENNSIEELEASWSASNKFRYSQIKALTPKDILDNWPAYKRSCGHRLIQLDFAVMFPKASSIVNTWDSNKLYEVLLSEGYINSKLIKESLSDLKLMDKSSQEASLLWATHGCLVPHQKVFKTGQDGRKQLMRYTIKESQNSFIRVFPTVEDLEESMRQLVEESEAIWPMIMVIGPDLEHITEIYVHFYGIKYPCKSIIEATDICFKIFHVFDLEYPKASETFWAFIEMYYFKMPAKVNFPKVHILCNSLNNRN